jgi:oxygen-independent coproporphyrinogen III oxidase
MSQIYLHIPFCVRKCGYCDFYSEDRRTGDLPAFLNALHSEIRLYSGFSFDASETSALPRLEQPKVTRNFNHGRRKWRGNQPVAAAPKAREKLQRTGDSNKALGATAIDSVFFGGGTPSLLSAGSVADLLDSIRRSFALSPDPEISIEANPGTLTQDLLRGYRDAGVNRISLGAQSFSDHDLAALGRIHSSEDCVRSARMIRDAGFDNLGLDLIFGIPGQTLDGWETTLRTALSLAPEHLSAYSLTVHPHTPFGRRAAAGEWQPAGEDDLAAFFCLGMDLTAAAGYEHYEVSNFSKPGFRCRHNEGYWTFEPYLGFGPSSHSFTGGKRFWNVADVSEYMERLSRNISPVAGSETIDRARRRLEAIALGLRRREGVLLDWIGEKRDTIPVLIEEGIALIENGSLKLTEKGFLLADAVAAELA